MGRTLCGRFDSDHGNKKTVKTPFALVANYRVLFRWSD